MGTIGKEARKEWDRDIALMKIFSKKTWIILCIFAICVLVQGCSQKENESIVAVEEENEQTNNNEIPDTEQEKENELMDELIWVTDQEITWNEEKEKKLLNFLQKEGWQFMASKITFLAFGADSFIEELKKWDDLVEEQEMDRSIAFISVHNEALAQELRKEDLCFDFYNMSVSEKYPEGNLKEFVPCEKAREILGDYVMYSTMHQISDVQQIDVPLVVYHYEEIASILME